MLIKNFHKREKTLFASSCIIILFVTFLALITSSCKDAYGTDPNVKKTPINFYKNLFAVDSADFSFSEIYSDFLGTSTFLWKQDVIYDTTSIKIDTSKQTHYLFIEFIAENTSDPMYIKSRSDRVKKISLKIDSLIVQKDSILRGITPNKVQCEVFIENMRNTSTIKYKIDSEDISVSFNNFANDKGTISFTIIIYVKNTGMYDTIELKIDCKIYYKI